MKYFKLSEFDSPDQKGSGSKMNGAFLDKLDNARNIAGVPFKITSGFRTQEHHEAIYQKLGKKPTRSAHLTGHAADIATGDSVQKYKIIAALIKAGFNRLGIAENFIHVDDSPDHTPNCIWTY